MTKDKNQKEEMKVKEKVENAPEKNTGNIRYSFPLVYVIAGLILLVVLSVLIYWFIVAK